MADFLRFYSAISAGIVSVGALACDVDQQQIKKFISDVDQQQIKKIIKLAKVAENHQDLPADISIPVSPG